MEMKTINLIQKHPEIKVKNKTKNIMPQGFYRNVIVETHNDAR